MQSPRVTDSNNSLTFRTDTQITSLGGRFLRVAQTEPVYRLHALGNRPGLARATPGASIAGEVWALPTAAIGALKPGDIVVTDGGLYARITKLIDDRNLVLEFGPSVQIKARKQAISEVVLQESADPLPEHSLTALNT